MDDLDSLSAAPDTLRHPYVDEPITINEDHLRQLLLGNTLDMDDTLIVSRATPGAQVGMHVCIKNGEALDPLPLTEQEPQESDTNPALRIFEVTVPADTQITLLSLAPKQLQGQATRAGMTEKASFRLAIQDEDEKPLSLVIDASGKRIEETRAFRIPHEEFVMATVGEYRTVTMGSIADPTTGKISSTPSKTLLQLDGKEQKELLLRCLVLHEREYTADVSRMIREMQQATHLSTGLGADPLSQLQLPTSTTQKETTAVAAFLLRLKTAPPPSHHSDTDPTVM